ncbi:MAG TPA: serine/threonine-protein kinase [Polyangia bacterium]|nr:serine/threonine-protein kinase [Polyangia bacterium]
MKNEHSLIANKYELVAPLGEGGMASVYRGLTHGAAGFTCKVAIKRVLPNLAENAAFVAMFVEEARVASELQHPNIVQVHDFDRDGEGRYFIVMEWIDGIDLFGWIESFGGVPTPWHMVAAIGVEMLRGLGAAHERVDAQGNPAPVIHRDVSPQNVLLSVQGIVKIADFGLARAADRATMTAPGTIKGKLGYMAPELVKRAPASAKSDLYSVGIVLWEALTGKRLYGGADAYEQVKKILANQVPQLRDVRSDVPLALAEIVHTALSFDPADRFERAEEMQRALASLTKNHTEPTDDRALARSIRDAMARRSRSKM